MRITPMDIEQQEFSRSFRGYNEEKEAKVIIEKAEMEAKALKQEVFQKEDLLKNEIDNLRRYKFTFKEKFKSMLNLYLKMIENEDFGGEGNYEFKENEMSKEKTKNKVSGEKTGKLEGLGIEENFKSKETEDEQ